MAYFFEANLSVHLAENTQQVEYLAAGVSYTSLPISNAKISHVEPAELDLRSYQDQTKSPSTLYMRSSEVTADGQQAPVGPPCRSRCHQYHCQLLPAVRLWVSRDLTNHRDQSILRWSFGRPDTSSRRPLDAGVQQRGVPREHLIRT